MEQNENPESPVLSEGSPELVERVEGPVPSEAEGPRRHRRSGDDWWEDWDGQDSSMPDEPCEPEDDGLPSPHLKPGEKTWVEAELERRGKGEAPRHSLPGEPKLPHEVYTPPPPTRTGTGFFYRNGDEIPPTHADHGPMHLVPRQQDGSFAAYYYCSKEELAAAHIDTPPPRRHRRDGFSTERQQIFVEHLRGTGSITDAARLTGISRSTVYNLYNSADAAAFRAAVGEALDATQSLLEATALERAIKGHEEIVYYKGQRVGVRWKADNRLLMSLLRARNPLKYAPLSEIEGWLARRGIARPADVEGALDRLAAAEAEWGRRLPEEPLPEGPAFAAARPVPAIEPPPPALAPPAKPPVQASTSSTLEVESRVQASNLSTLPAAGEALGKRTDVHIIPSSRRRPGSQDQESRRGSARRRPSPG
jgi:AcrR family transcriptional regulator